MATEPTTIREDLSFRLCRRPFVPFIVELADGSRHAIERVAQMAIGLTIGTIGEKTGDISRHIKLTDVKSIRGF
jgi:hypothetical protein